MSESQGTRQLGTVHVWEKVEITLVAKKTYANPYAEVEAWVDLRGPGFSKRVYGFWDGEAIFRVRVLATSPGEWLWVSGSNQADDGLNGRTGGFRAKEWTESEKQAKPDRRGFLRATANGHALEYADGTPCFLLGDTWWATPTFRHRWYEDDVRRPVGPEMGFKDMVRFRKAQGYNCIAILAAFPQWANDGGPCRIQLDDQEKTTIRSAWPQAGTRVGDEWLATGREAGFWGGECSAKDMHNEGGRPFFFPGRVPGYEGVFPDVDRINPAYFQHMDKKIDYLNSQGFVPFIEVARRDASQAWKRFYDWPESYVRYVQYVFSRYQGNNCILSPIHLDSGHLSILSRDYNEPANMVVEKGVPAFGTLLSCNASGSSLSNFGNSDEARWLTLHQIGNRRHHNSHWLLTQIYLESVPPKPALNGEPYYAGFPPGRSVPPDTDEAALYCRSGMYGSFLSGGFAGHIYGAAGLWSGDIEPEADYKMWDALQWDSGAQMQHLRTFALSEGLRYRDLVPDADLVYPSKSYDVRGNRGWAYCARTPEKDLLMLYFEAGCPQATVRAAQYLREYEGTWFNPRTGEWTPAGTLASYTRDEEARDFDPERDERWKALGSRASAPSCEIHLPPLPSDDDWALKLVLKE